MGQCHSKEQFEPDELQYVHLIKPYIRRRQRPNSIYDIYKDEIQRTSHVDTTRMTITSRRKNPLNIKANRFVISK
jgi:hypothetical protein